MSNDILIQALQQAVNVIRDWHQADDVWQIYYDKSPEMKPIRDAFDQVAKEMIAEDRAQLSAIPQETVEQAADKWVEQNVWELNGERAKWCKKDFIAGANWKSSQLIEQKIKEGSLTPILMQNSGHGLTQDISSQSSSAGVWVRFSERLPESNIWRIRWHELGTRSIEPDNYESMGDSVELKSTGRTFLKTNIEWLNESAASSNDADYWKEKFEHMKKRCEAAEEVIKVCKYPENDARGDNTQFELFRERNHLWQQLKNQQHT